VRISLGVDDIELAEFIIIMFLLEGAFLGLNMPLLER
jgi:hypothetical protein